MIEKEIDKLAWLCIRDRKVLCVRSRGKKAFYIPGGKRDTGETDQQALIREIREELSVDVTSDTIEFYGAFSAQADDKPETVAVRISCYQANYTGELAVDSEIEEMAWFDSSDLASCSLVVKKLLSDLRERGLID